MSVKEITEVFDGVTLEEVEAALRFVVDSLDKEPSFGGK
jgi:uncharacterized protein (DUF433 family)